MTLQEQLCEKMRVEQSAYCLWLTAQPPEEILHHAYEYSVREDIILATEEMNLTPAQVRALLKSPAPLADVYKDFSKLETDYIHASKFLDFVWSEKLGYLLLHIDPTENTIEEDQIITSADELCAELFNEVATDVFQEAKREHFYPDADDDEIAEIRRRWQPYLDLLPEYRSSCRAFHTAE